VHPPDIFLYPYVKKFGVGNAGPWQGRGERDGCPGGAKIKK